MKCQLMTRTAAVLSRDTQVPANYCCCCCQ